MRPVHMGPTQIDPTPFPPPYDHTRAVRTGPCPNHGLLVPSLAVPWPRWVTCPDDSCACSAQAHTPVPELGSCITPRARMPGFVLLSDDVARGLPVTLHRAVYRYWFRWGSSHPSASPHLPHLARCSEDTIARGELDKLVRTYNKLRPPQLQVPFLSSEPWFAVYRVAMEAREHGNPRKECERAKCHAQLGRGWPRDTHRRLSQQVRVKRSPSQFSMQGGMAGGPTTRATASEGPGAIDWLPRHTKARAYKKYTSRHPLARSKKAAASGSSWLDLAVVHLVPSSTLGTSTQRVPSA